MNYFAPRFTEASGQNINKEIKISPYTEHKAWSLCASEGHSQLQWPQPGPGILWRGAVAGSHLTKKSNMELGERSY